MRLDRVLVKDRLESKLRHGKGERHGWPGWIGSWSKIGLRANSDSSVLSLISSSLDRVLVKDRLESKLRHAARLLERGQRWIGSWSKIGLRANSDELRQLPVYKLLDRVLVKDRLESKLRHQHLPAGDLRRWIGSWSKIGLRANSDTNEPFTTRSGLDRVLVKDRLESKRQRTGRDVGGRVHKGQDECW